MPEVTPQDEQQNGDRKSIWFFSDVTKAERPALHLLVGKDQDDGTVATDAETVDGLDVDDLVVKGSDSLEDLLQQFRDKSEEANAQRKRARIISIVSIAVGFFIGFFVFGSIAALFSMNAFAVAYATWTFLWGGVLWKAIQELRQFHVVFWLLVMLAYAGGLVALCVVGYFGIVFYSSLGFYLFTLAILYGCTNYSQLRRNAAVKLETNLKLGAFAEEIVGAVNWVQQSDDSPSEPTHYDNPPTSGQYDVLSASDETNARGMSSSLTFGFIANQNGEGWVLSGSGSSSTIVAGFVSHTHRAYCVEQSRNANNLSLTLYKGSFDPDQGFTGESSTPEGVRESFRMVPFSAIGEML